MSSPKTVTAVLGPTNTGKTHLAVERMLGHGGGMIGLPLRLLAREIYDRVRLRAGDAAVALGKEVSVPMRACNLTLEEMTEAMNRGWAERDSRSAMLLQQERAGVKIAVDAEKLSAVVKAGNG